MQSITRAQASQASQRSQIDLSAHRADQPKRPPVAEDVKKFLANGGKIKIIPQGVSGNNWRGY